VVSPNDLRDVSTEDRRPDGLLLAACRAGDQDAYGVFYVRYREALLGFLARRTPSAESAADLLAETFAAALVAVYNPESALPTHPAGWLFGIARNLLADSLRRGRVEATARRRLGLPALVLDDADIERVADAAEAAGLLDEAFAGLSTSDRALLTARVVDERTYAELADRLQCSEVVVRKRVSRAKAHLRAVLGGSRA
jgi:RNA polymerase sigma factor (sigma-70 family)